MRRCERILLSILCLSLAATFLPGSLASQEVQKIRMMPKRDHGPLEDGKEGSQQGLIKQGWIYLFDSRVLQDENVRKRHQRDPMSLWRLRRLNPENNHWSVVEEEGQLVLKNTIERGAHGTDIISRQSFWDFDLHVELCNHTNSGIYLRGRYEIQINGTEAGRDRKLSAGELGGIYSLSAPLVNASKGRGVWQTVDARIRGLRGWGWLNGELIQDNVDLTPRKGGTGSQLGMGDGIFSNDPDSPGPIFLQGDHGSVDFRNIRIRPLSGPRMIRKIEARPLRLQQPRLIEKKDQ